MMDTQTLWEEYSRSKSAEAKRLLALEYIGIVKFVVSKFRAYSKRSASLLDEQDLLQLGMMGLLDSMDRFDPTRGVKFETYAITRIRGTIQDELRKLDWVPRSVREKVRIVDRVTQKLECSDTLQGAAKTLASEWNMSVEEYLGIFHETRGAVPEIFSRGENGENVLDTLATDEINIADKVADDQSKRLLIRFVEQLPIQDRLVISLYYYEELTFKEIANVLKLSESRIFQKHAAILGRIREQIGELV